MTFQIALNFEDGVTRIIECRPDETVADASYRSRINIPLDCRDGACGTCKSFCESGSYDGGDYIEDALSDDEAAGGYVLTCQMVPESDCIVHIPATSDVAKVGITAHTGRVSAVNPLSETTAEFSISLDDRGALGFLPGQYVNVLVPGTDQTRSYSFSSPPGDADVSFVIRNTPSGALSTYLRERVKVGDAIEFNGALGSFYLRELKRPTLFLAGGTGLAPFLSMLGKLEADGGAAQPVHLVFGVSNDTDLVKLDVLEGYAARMPSFTFDCCVADPGSSHPNKGYVTGLIRPEHLNDGELDVYLCGPPPMVDAVRDWLRDQGVVPMSFYYEKFAGTGVVSAIGEEHVKVDESDTVFDARMALELGAVQLSVGRLSLEQLAELRRLAEATAPTIVDGRFTDVAAFRATNAEFHGFLVQVAGNDTICDLYQGLAVQDYMSRTLTDGLAVPQQIIQDHLDLVGAFEKNDVAAAREIIVAHAERSKATMRGGIERAGAAT